MMGSFVSYPTFFVFIPETRDFPWVTLLLFFLGAILLGVGLKRAFQQPNLYRGKVLGSILATISTLAFVFFVFGIFYMARLSPASSATPRIGEKAPEFTLPDQHGKLVTLTEILSNSGETSTRANGALLIFYRGHW
jgi:hypothetical protein